MNVRLSNEQEAAVKAKLATGQFADAEEVIAAVLEALDEKTSYESPELEAALLDGLREEHSPYGSETLDKVRSAAAQTK
jgi:Arc/MetJ-type ribon-helix-helix transcriptional regulator